MKFKSQASSARAGSSAFGFGALSTFQASSSPLAYVTEQPDLTQVVDPNLVVCLKNLAKKDSTTKSKALEELQDYVKSTPSADIDGAVINAWCLLYPRTSIDNSRRVRQLAHSTQGSLASSTTKRILPYLNNTIGPWLSGTYDNDRAVQRAAEDALAQAFPTLDKRQKLWKAYRKDLLEYAEDAILLQTVATLSDDRSTTKEDAEAKYCRVAGSAMFMLARLLHTIDPEQSIQPEAQAKLDDILSRKALWEFAYHPDPYLRRACYELVVLSVRNCPSSINWPTLSTCFVAKALTTSQLGSSAPFVRALTLLTSLHPSIWTTYYHAKTTAFKKLLQCLARGSQRGPESYWSDINTLVKSLPREVLSSTAPHQSHEDAMTLITALREGIVSHEEPRQNLTAAWTCYIDLCFTFQAQLDSKETRESFLAVHPLPLVTMYANPPPQSSTLPAASSLRLGTSIMTKLAENEFETLFIATWDTLLQGLMERMRMSLPETSKDFVSSQDAVVAHSSRLRKLQQSLVVNESAHVPAWVLTCFRGSSARLVTEALDLVQKRNGKPYGAAAVLQDFSSTGESENVLSFLEGNMSIWLESPSAERLVSLLQDSSQDLVPFITYLVGRPTLNSYGQSAFSFILANASLLNIDAAPQLREFIVNSASTSSGLSGAQSPIPSLLRNPHLENSIIRNTVIVDLINDTSTTASPDRRESALSLIASMVNDRRSRAAFTDGENGTRLHSNLLLLVDSADQLVSDQAGTILNGFRSVEINGVARTEARTMTLIHDQLSGSLPQMSILSLVELAATQLKMASATTETLIELLPRAEDWQKALQPHQGDDLPHALSITSPLQGVVYTVGKAKELAPAVIRDAEDFSLFFRLTLYTIRVLSATAIAMNETAEKIIMQYLPLALQYVNEKLTVESSNSVWLGTTTPEVHEEAADVLSVGNDIIQRILSLETAETLWTARLRNLPESSAILYHDALALNSLMSRVIDRDGPSSFLDLLKTDLNTLHKNPALILSATVISCLKESFATSSQGKRLLNELVSDITDLKSLDLQSIRALVLINVFLGEDSEPLAGVQSQRLFVLVEYLVKLLGNSHNEWSAISEILKLLNSLLPAVQEIYGTHWQHIVNFLVRIWNTGLDIGTELPVLHSSLRLYSKIKALAAVEDANEDLTDALQTSKAELSDGLLQCLQLFLEPFEGINQPRQITAMLLSRLLHGVAIKDTAPLYQLMTSSEDAILGAAYSVLHGTIPQLQGDLSLELALESRNVALPPELLDLIVDLPDTVERSGFAKRYLLCWQLIFDHFENASYKLKESYLASLKGTSHLTGFLDLVCNIIRIANTHPVDASKFELERFDLGITETETRELQWLAIHLYYRCLLFAPSLARAWFIEQKNRIKNPLEAWTQKYISQAIAFASFDTVSQWASTQDQEDSPVTVKANAKSFELIASVEIDPENPPSAITIVLPPSYPLNSPTVVSRTRVAVSDKNWQAWLRTFQIIIFSTGSIIEGLVAFRRNVQGAIKGHGECVICYSIISTDMKTPDKKCGICKNMFHGTCLFKWFKSSGSSTCPLCRNTFTYG